MTTEARQPPDQSYPLTELVGRIYRGGKSGALTLFDARGESPLYAFWFKRGYPCFSWSGEGVASLGEQFPVETRPLIEQVLADPDHSGRLMGQRLISAGVVSLEDVQAALLSQMKQRFVACASMGTLPGRFEDGMDVFGRVPLSSPVLNPVEIAVGMAQATPLVDIERYLGRKVTSTHLRFSKSRPIPPGMRRSLPDTLVRQLEEGTSTTRLLATAPGMKILACLAGFGYVEGVVPSTPAQPEVEADGDLHSTTGLGTLVQAVRGGATWYELMGVSFIADRMDIKRRYREIAFQIHPDRLHASQVSASREVFALVVEGYRTLTKERLRAAYDTTLVESGRIRRLGAPQDVRLWLALREEQLQEAGLSSLAQDYGRMRSIVEGDRDRDFSRRSLGQPWGFAQEGVGAVGAVP